nr:CoA transferase [Rhizobium sp. TCK]
MARAFDGLRVIDATHVLAGPFAAYQLGLLGADVIRIDRPDDPDQSRLQGADRELNAAAMGTAFLAQGSNKRSIALDLKSSEGQETLHALLRDADVFVQNFRPGALAELGFGYDELSRINPRLVYCSISAFGQTGPRAQETGYDNVFQAISGMMAMTGTPEVAPLKAGAPVVDYATGYIAAFAISAALFQRERTGRGQHVDLAMFDASLMLMGSHISALTVGGLNPRPNGNRFPMAGLGTYATKAGVLMLGAGNLRQQRRLWNALGRPEMIKGSLQQSVDDAEREGKVLRDIFLTRAASEWEEFLRSHRVPAGRVRDLKEALDDPQLSHRAALLNVDLASPIGAVRLPGTAFLLSGCNPRIDRAPPRVDEHGEEIRQWVGKEQSHC